MEAHPFGTVPAAFSPDGKTGIFESNSIMRAVARLGESRFPLYGRDAYEASRIDSFLDASLVFARDSQIYLLSLISGTVSPEIHSRTRDAFAIYAAGINQALSPDREFLVGDSISIADICFVAEVSLFFNEKARPGELIEERPRTDSACRRRRRISTRLCPLLQDCAQHPAFAPDVEPYLKKIESARHADTERSAAR